MESRKFDFFFRPGTNWQKIIPASIAREDEDFEGYGITRRNWEWMINGSLIEKIKTDIGEEKLRKTIFHWITCPYTEYKKLETNELRLFAAFNHWQEYIVKNSRKEFLSQDSIKYRDSNFEKFNRSLLNHLTTAVFIDTTYLTFEAIALFLRQPFMIWKGVLKQAREYVEYKNYHDILDRTGPETYCILPEVNVKRIAYLKRKRINFIDEDRRTWERNRYISEFKMYFLFPPVDEHTDSDYYPSY